MRFKIAGLIILITILFCCIGCASSNLSEHGGQSPDQINRGQTSKNPKISESKALKEDFAALKIYLTQCYVGYDTARKNGFDVDKAISRMKLHYTLSKLSHKRQPKAKRDKYTFHNGIDNWAMTYGIGRVLYEDMDKAGIKDSHFAVYGDENWRLVSPKKWPYFSNLYFDKSGDDYFVAVSTHPEIKTGMKYTDDTENLRKTFVKGKELYEYIIFDMNYRTTAEINIEKKKYTISVFCEDFIQTEKGHVGFVETEDSMYISLGDCKLELSDKNKHEELMNRYNEVIENAKNGVNKKNIIVDFRGNSGGYSMYPEGIWRSVFYGNSEGKSRVYSNFTNHFETGTITLVSKEIQWARYQNILINPGFGEDAVKNAKDAYDELAANPKRVYDGLLDPVLQDLPQVKNSDFDGRVFVLIDKMTASAAEIGTAFSFLENKDLVTLIGTNSSGCIEYGGRFLYKLPNSQVEISLCCSDMRKAACLAHNPKWHGDTEGFYPDYWVRNRDLLNVLIDLTGDKDLRKGLSGLDKAQK